MKSARDYLERKRLEKMRQATKKSLSGKKDAAAATPRPSSAGKGFGICYDFQAGKCTRGKDCKCKHEKAVQELRVDQRLRVLGIKCVSSEKQVSAIVVVNVLSSIRPSLQHRPPRTTSEQEEEEER